MKIKLNLKNKFLPFFVIFVVSVFFFYYDPPHSICETQIESYKRTLKGKLYGYLDNKNTVPPKIKKALDICKEGRSAGSCIDYFDIINVIMTNMNQVQLECLSDITLESTIIENLKKFFITALILSWGDEVPSDSKTNWLSSSNILVFCKVKKYLETYLDQDEYDKLVLNSLSSFPYEKITLENKENSVENQRNKAIIKMSREDLINKTILSLRCERYM